MKKLTFLLMPVMPGFEAWAVSGFIESPDKSDGKTNSPAPIASDALKKLTHGFTCEAGDMVFIQYDRVCRVLHELAHYSHVVSIQPLDRGGVLASGELTESGWNKVSTTIAWSEVVESTVSESK